MKSRLLTGVVFAALAGTSAAGADFSRPVYRRPVMVAAPVYNWSGFYVGVNAGYAWSENTSVNSSGTVISNPGTGGFVLTVAPIAAAGLTNPIPVSKSNGFIGGGQIGYNYHFGNFVAGVETDIQGLSGRGSGTTATSLPSVVPGERINATLTATSSVKWLGTLRGQLGFTMAPSLLVYGTGGLAYGDVSSSTTIGQQIVGAVAVASGVGAPYGSLASISQTRTGWAAGAGAAWLISGNWSAKLEYLHYDLGSVSYSGSLSNLSTVGAPVAVGTVLYTLGPTSSTSFRADVVRVGLNYKFGYAAAPAVYK